MAGQGGGDARKGRRTNIRAQGAGPIRETIDTQGIVRPRCPAVEQEDIGTGNIADAQTAHLNATGAPGRANRLHGKLGFSITADRVGAVLFAKR